MIRCVCVEAAGCFGRVYYQSDRLSWDDRNDNSHRFYDDRAGLIMALCCGSRQVIMIDLMRLLAEWTLGYQTFNLSV